MGVVKLSTAGILDYQKYSSLLAGNTAFLPGAFHLLETQVLASSESSVTFSSLSTYAADYQHLQIRMVAKSADGVSSNLRDLRIQVNADTAANYAAHVLRGDGADVASNSATSQTSIATATSMLPRPSNPTADFGAAIIDVLDAFETSKYSIFRMFGGAKPSGEDQIWLASGLWMNTNALTEIKLFANSGNLGINSRFSLYGIRGG